MKKIIALLLVIVLSLFCFAGALTISSSGSGFVLDGPDDVPAQVLPQ
jgi:hypothetical protein